MNTWFIRCNGETKHNDPASSLYMPGEPPSFPRTDFNYRQECLESGFARVGWPAAGDLRRPGWRARAIDTYAGVIKPYHAGYLEQFVTIGIGDLILLPTYTGRYNVHLGIVEPGPPSEDGLRAGGSSRPYYYHYDLEAGDWYENAQRVNVRWHRHANGAWTQYHLPQIGGLWMKGFGRVEAGHASAVHLARSAGLLT